MHMEYNPGKESFTKPADDSEIKQKIQEGIEEYHQNKNEDVLVNQPETTEFVGERMYVQTPVMIREYADFSKTNGYTIKTTAGDLSNFFKNKEAIDFLGKNTAEELYVYLNANSKRPYHIPLLTLEDFNKQDGEKKKAIKEFLDTTKIDLDIYGLEAVESEDNETFYYALGKHYPRFEEEYEYLGDKDIRILLTSLQNGERQKVHIDLEKRMTATELKDKARVRAGNLIASGKYERPFSAMRRALEETMSPEEYQMFATVASLIGKKYGIDQFTNENLEFSTNKVGLHSWYLVVPNKEYDPDHTNEDIEWNKKHGWQNKREDDYKLSPTIIIKISDHPTRYVQSVDNRGRLLYETYVIDSENNRVHIVDNFSLGGESFSSINEHYIDRDDEGIPFGDLEKEIFSKKE